MPQAQIGSVLALALRCKDKDQMQEVSEVVARLDGGLVGDIAAQPDRGITILSASQWKDVQRELKTELPWYTRRANVLVDAERLGHLIGAELRIGEVKIKVEGETRPCQLMDRLHHGLRSVLVPECRGGVHGRVLQAGAIRIGDVIVMND